MEAPQFKSLRQQVWYDLFRRAWQETIQRQKDINDANITAIYLANSTILAGSLSAQHSISLLKFVTKLGS